MFAKKSLRDKVEEFGEKIGPAVEDALDQVGPYLADAKEKAGPALTDAKETAREATDTARERFATEVAPLLAAAVATAGEKAAPVREEAKRRGLATAAALKGEVEAPKRKRSKLKGLLILGGLGALGAFVFSKLKQSQAPAEWTSSYTPAQPPSPAAAGGATGSAASTAPAGDPLTDESFGTSAKGSAPVSDDLAGSSPDEAISDETVEAREATTPDNPVEETDVSDQPDPKA